MAAPDEPVGAASPAPEPDLKKLDALLEESLDAVYSGKKRKGGRSKKR